MRSGRSLIQTIGRAARHVNGTAILYADKVTDSMRRAIGETERRRAKQTAFNAAEGITPRSVSKRIKDIIDGVYDPDQAKEAVSVEQERARYQGLSEKDLSRAIRRLEREMLAHAKNLEFERAAALRDELSRLRRQAFGASPHE